MFPLSMISTTLGTQSLLTTQLQRRLSDLAPVRHSPTTRHDLHLHCTSQW